MSQLEKSLAEFVSSLKADQVPPPARRVVRLMALAVIGTAVAGVCNGVKWGCSASGLR